MEPGREERVAAFGRWLRQERELRALPASEVVRLTKLAPGVVDSLEAGVAERMPPRAYLVGYLRAYAAAVGLDPDDAVLRWQEASGEAADGGGEAAPRRWRARWLRPALVAAAVALAALAVAGILLARQPRKLVLPDRSSKPMERAPYVQP